MRLYKLTALLLLAVSTASAYSKTPKAAAAASEIAAKAFVQTPADAPRLPRFDKTEWTLLATDAAVRGLDVYSTHRMLWYGNREANMPVWIAKRPAAMSLFSGGIVMVQFCAARKLFAHHHRKWAYLVTAADISIDAPSAIHNLVLPSCVGPSTSAAGGCQQSSLSSTGPIIPVPIPDVR